MRKMHLTKENSDDLGFANICLTYSAITFDEFKNWIYAIIESSDDYPSFLFDILDAKEKFDYTLKVRQIIGFNPSWDPSESEHQAIAGIAYKRFPNHKSDVARKDPALKALTANPHIESRFRETFPFITW